MGAGAAAAVRRVLSWSHARSLLTEPARLPALGALLLAVELVLNMVIVQRVPYTEIDWRAYMQECEGFLNGTRNYALLRGDTGPLVYPAGFVYIYSLLYYATAGGQNVRRAQYAFLALYLLQLALVLRIYIKSRKVPPYVLALTVLTSYRIHSVYVLRLFNDPVALVLFYVSLNLFLDSRWYLGSLFYSLAVSVKMNILLYAPALLIFYLINLGWRDTFKQLSVCAAVQGLLGLPFLLHSPVSYVRGSFDVGRIFNHTWTVNYRFLDVETFESKCFHLTLLGVHLVLLFIFYPMCKKYFTSYCRLRAVQRQFQPQIDAKNKENKHRKKAKANLKKVKLSDTNTEVLSNEQENFLKSFETALQKSTGNQAPRPLEKSIGNQAPRPLEKPTEEPFYSINFDGLSQLFILPMFVANLIGVTCARSLHYQFYSWYFHSLPYLLWSTHYSTVVRFFLLAVIELCWNTYPSTTMSSSLLHVCHVAILYGVYRKHYNEMKLASKV